MSLMTAILMGVSGPEVSITGSNPTNSGSPTIICRLKIDADGSWYISDAAGAYGAATGVWLTEGVNSEVWVERTIDAGAFNDSDFGASRVVCSTDRVMGVSEADAIDSQTGTVTLNFYDAASGGNLLDSAQFVLTATTV